MADTHGQFNLQTLSTNELGHYNGVVISHLLGHVLYYYNNRTYFVWVSKTYCTYIQYYDHIGRVFSAAKLVQTPTYQDSHAAPGMIVTNTGHILVAAEKIYASSQGHPGTVYINRSNNPEDISSFTEVATLGNNSSYRRCYPQFVKLGSRIYCILRDSRPKLYLYYSDDDGINWVGGIEGINIVDCIDTSYHWAYTTFEHSDSKIRFAISMYESYTPSYARYLFYLESSDGNIFTNIQGTYTHDVSIDGPIGLTTLTEWFLLRDSGANVQSDVDGISLSPEGRLYFLVRHYENTYPATKMAYLRYWDTDLEEWVEKTITPFSDFYMESGTDFWTTFALKIKAYSNDIIDVYGIVDGYVQRWYSADGGDNWYFVEQIADNSFPHYWLELSNVNASNDLAVISALDNNGITSADIVFGLAPSPLSRTIVEIVGDTATTDGYIFGRDKNGRLWCTTRRVLAGKYIVYAYYSDDGGNTWTEEEVYSHASLSVYAGGLAVAGDGAVYFFIVGWSPSSATVFNLTVRKRNTNGVYETIYVTINTTAGYHTYNGTMVIDPDGQTVHIVWAGKHNANRGVSPAVTNYREFYSNSNMWTTNHVLIGPTLDNSPSSPKLIFSRLNPDKLMAFMPHNDSAQATCEVYYNYSLDKGATWVGQTKILSNDDIYSIGAGFTCVVDSLDTVHGIFIYDDGDGENKKTAYANSSNWQGTIFILDEDVYGSPYLDITIDSNDILTAIYRVEQGLVFRKSYDRGATWTARVLIAEGYAASSTNGALRPTYPQHVLGKGIADGFCCIFSKFLDEEGDNYLYFYKSNNISWGQPMSLRRNINNKGVLNGGF